MRTMDFFWRIAQRCAFVTMVMCVVSCGGEDDPIVPTPEPTPDPDNGEVSFVINNEGGSGSGSSSSPAEVSKGDTLNMVISQKSSYTDSDGSVFTCEPKATIELFAKMDTVYVKDKNLLTDVKNPEVKTSQSGTSLVRNLTTQSFQIGEGQYINFDLAYEVYKHINKENQTIEMPYVKLNQARFGTSEAKEEPTARSETPPEITLKPIAVQTRATVIDTTMYEVNAKFSIDIESVNAKTDNKQTLTFSVTYIGVVETATETPDPDPELVSIKYRPSWIWEEAHDNLPLLYYAEVFRDRHYSNGEVFTDRFVDNGHPVEMIGCIRGGNDGGYIGTNGDDYNNSLSGEYFMGGGRIFYFGGSCIHGDSIKITTHSTEVDDLSLISTENGEYTGTEPGNWENYVTGKTYSDELNMTENKTPYQTGWYFQGFAKDNILNINYNGIEILSVQIAMRIYDQFLVIDGKQITFLDFKPKTTFTTTIEDISETATKGPAKVIKYECKTETLGRNFYNAAIDTIYQRKK